MGLGARSAAGASGVGGASGASGARGAGRAGLARRSAIINTLVIVVKKHTAS